MSLSKDLARRRALLHAAELLQSAMDAGVHDLYAEDDPIGTDGYSGMTGPETVVQDKAMKGLIAELETRAGIGTMALERSPRGALRVRIGQRR